MVKQAAPTAQKKHSIGYQVRFWHIVQDARNSKYRAERPKSDERKDTEHDSAYLLLLITLILALTRSRRGHREVGHATSF